MENRATEVCAVKMSQCFIAQLAHRTAFCRGASLGKAAEEPMGWIRATRTDTGE